MHASWKRCCLTHVVGCYSISDDKLFLCCCICPGGLIPVLSVLQCLGVPKAWAGRWGYLVTPHIGTYDANLL